MKEFLSALQKPSKYMLRIVLAITLGIAVVLQIIRIMALNTITHDDAISYITSTGNLFKFKPENKWVEAKEWKQYLNNDNFFCFKDIQESLVERDIHPPLYFWTLHIWIALVGTHIWTGPILNLLFFVLTFWILYILARQVLGDNLLAAMSVIIWSLNPSVFYVSEITRQYSLFSLFTVFFIYILYRYLYISKPGWILFFALSLSVALGLLTHYYFSLLIGAGLTFVLIESFYGKTTKSFFQICLSTILGILIFIMVHPLFLHSFYRESHDKQYNSISGTLPRLKQIFSSFFSFYFPYSPHTGEFYIFLLILGGVAWVLFFNYKKKQLKQSNALQILIRQRYILFLLLSVSLIVIGLYMSGISPGHAMSDRYLSFIFPLMALFPFVILLAVKLPLRYILAVCLCLWQFFYALDDTISHCSELKHEQLKLKSLRLLQSSTLILDSDVRGVWGSIIWNVPNKIKVFVGPQDSLITESNSFLTNLKLPAIYVGDLTYENNIQNQNIILGILKKHGFNVRLANGNFFGAANVYYIN